jgi:hypothetical protein
LLLTVMKMPRIMHSSGVCAHIARCITSIQHVAVEGAGAGGLELQQQPQQQQQQQQSSSVTLLPGTSGSAAAPPSQHADLLRSAPQLELQRAVLVLAGRYLLLVSDEIREYVSALEVYAARPPDVAMWLVHVLLHTDLRRLRSMSEAELAELQGPLAGVIDILRQPSIQEVLCSRISSRRSSSGSSGSSSGSDDDLVMFTSYEDCHVRGMIGWATPTEPLQSWKSARDSRGCFSMVGAVMVLQEVLLKQLRVWFPANYWRGEKLYPVLHEIEQIKVELSALQVQGGRLSTKDRLKQKVLLGQQQSLEDLVSDQNAKFGICEDIGFQMSADNFAGILYDIGLLLCAQLPSRFCCNHPACSSLSTASEGFLLVRGQSCVCGGCLMGSRRPVLAPTFCTAAR